MVQTANGSPEEGASRNGDDMSNPMWAHIIRLLDDEEREDGRSQPELGTNRIVRFVTKQAPAPQALKFLGGAREGEEGRVLY